jgi:hypothetical protein
MEEINSNYCPLTSEWLAFAIPSFYLVPDPLGGSTIRSNKPVNNVYFMNIKTLFDVTERLQFQGGFWEFDHKVDLHWSIAADDRRLAEPLKEPERFYPHCPVHIHTNYVFNNSNLHIDYLHVKKTGPTTGFYEYRVFQDGEQIGRGGSWGTTLGLSGRLNWPLAWKCKDYLILITRFPDEEQPTCGPAIKIFHSLDPSKVEGKVFDFTLENWNESQFKEDLIFNLPNEVINEPSSNSEAIDSFTSRFSGCLLDEETFIRLLCYWVGDNHYRFKGDKRNWARDELEKWENRILEIIKPVIYDAINKSKKIEES